MIYKDLVFIYRNKHQNEKFTSIKFPFVQLKKPTNFGGGMPQEIHQAQGQLWLYRKILNQEII